MPKVIIIKGYRVSDWTFMVTESTPWEDISKEDLDYLKKNGGNSFTILEQVTAHEATLSVKAMLEDAERKNKEREEKIKLAEEQENRRRELEKEKRKKRELARAKKLLEQEGILKNDSKYDSNGQPW